MERIRADPLEQSNDHLNLSETGNETVIGRGIALEIGLNEDQLGNGTDHYAATSSPRVQHRI